MGRVGEGPCNQRVEAFATRGPVAQKLGLVQKNHDTGLRVSVQVRNIIHRLFVVPGS